MIMSDDEILTDAELKSELMEARDKIRRELEILMSPSSIGGGADNREVIALLEKELGEIQAALNGRG